LEWLVKVWPQLHRRSGNTWHVVAPTLRPINDKESMVTHANYNEDLAFEFARIYGLSRDDMPCLVLDTFDQSERQLKISIPRDEQDRLFLLESIDEFLARTFPNPYSWEDRPSHREVVASLFDYVTTKMVIRGLVNWAPRLGSIAVRAVAGRF
jgi:hypothetical protein